MHHYLDDPFARYRHPGRRRGRPVTRIRVPVRVVQEEPEAQETSEAPDAEQVQARSAEPGPSPAAGTPVPQGQDAERTQEENQESAEANEADWKDKYLRLYAELENTKKRLERRYADEAEREKERLLRDILPLADNLERALHHANGQDEGLRRGVELTLKAFLDVLAQHGVEPIDALGQPFDPHLHEAVGVVHDPNLPPDTVAEVEQTGYTYRGRLLRPARVYVNRA